MTVHALPDRHIKTLLDAGAILNADSACIQPASLDLCCGATFTQLACAALPGPTLSVAQMQAELAARSNGASLHAPALLMPNRTYIAPLRERLDLPADVFAIANAKSSTGRIDVIARLIGENASRYDELPYGYRGPLYLEITPRSFPILISEGDALIQLRLFARRSRAAAFDLDAHMRALHPGAALTTRVPAACAAHPGDDRLANAVTLALDLEGETGDDVVAWRARRNAPHIDLSARGLPARDFWAPIHAAETHAGLRIDPDEFYILASHEKVQIPPTLAAEMIDIDTRIMPGLVHLAGFLDPGFGVAPSGEPSARAVLEVRGVDRPFLLRHGQDVCRMVYGPLASPPDAPYGPGSSYQGQGLRLAKYFVA